MLFDDHRHITNKARIWLLGEKYYIHRQRRELYGDVCTRILLTYRKGFEPINGIAPTSDKGWGCMLRCGQMVVAQALLVKHLGRGWRWKKDSENKIYRRILRMFHDDINSFYSVHRIAQMGACDGIPVGSQYTPNDIAQILKDLSVDDKWNNLTIHVALDNLVCIRDIKTVFAEKEANTEFAKCAKSLLLFVPLRIGLTKADPVYFDSLKATFKLKNTLGVIGGRPHRGLYFIGYTGNKLLYFDPHKTQKVVDPSKMDDSSYHQEKFDQMNIDQLDPSISLCFHFQTESEFDEWCLLVQKLFIVNQKQPLFELSEITFNKEFSKNEIFDSQLIDYDYV